VRRPRRASEHDAELDEDRYADRDKTDRGFPSALRQTGPELTKLCRPLQENPPLICK